MCASLGVLAAFFELQFVHAHTRLVHELSPQDGEQVSLDARVLTEIGQPFEEVEERLLDDVLGVGRLLEPPAREGQQPTLVALDEGRPPLRDPAADLVEQVPVGLCELSHCVQG